MNKAQIPLKFKPLEIGVFKSNDEELKAVFGEPHFIETNHYRTAGGNEWFWAFEDEGDIFAFLYRCPYEEVNIWVQNASDTKKALDYVKSIFGGTKIEIYESPYQHL